MIDDAHAQRDRIEAERRDQRAATTANGSNAAPPNCGRARPSCRRILESASDAIIVTDPRRSIVMANSAALRCFGMTREAIVGTTLEHLFPSPCVKRSAARSTTRSPRAARAAGIWN